ncbi:FtsX-like permease family protein [Catellatospora sp. NPDC049609]|uniref:FtsX-like permease family protein n=1 Tax=Catellatospora sp. NPDC049609 TaxID=3155505 RepID=UPI003419D4FD
MRWLRAWIPALRIARREARRAKGRSLLVIAMLGLPALGLSFAATVYDMNELRPAEQLDRELGRYDADVQWIADAPIVQGADGRAYQFDGPAREKPTTAEDLLRVLPAGSRVTQVVSDFTEVYTPDGVAGITGRTLDVADPQLAGMVSVLSGTAPRADGEAAVNARLARRLDVGVGGTVRTVLPDRTYRITALVEFPDSLSEALVLPPTATTTAAARGFSHWLVDTPAPLLWADVQQLNTKGLLVRSRAVVLDPPPDDPRLHYGRSSDVEELSLGVVLIGLIILEIVLLAGPAFAVGARRRSRDLALVAASGGTPGHLRRIVLADGIVLGLAAALGGIVLGIGLATAARPLIEEHLVGARSGGWRFLPLGQAAIAATAVGTGLLAAMVPAFTAARQSVVTVLAGRRGVVRSRKRWITLGLVMAATGAVIAVAGAFGSQANVILGGLVVGELGLVLLTPSLVGLISRAGRWLPLAPRIALRDTARNRGSAAPAISAVMAAVAGAVAIGAFVGSEARHSYETYDPQLPVGHFAVRFPSGPDDPPPDLARLASAVREAVPGAEPHVIPTVACPEPADPRKRQCSIDLVLPEAHRCPGWADPPTEGVVTMPDDDPRCRYRGGNWMFYLAVDDGSGLAALSTAPPDELAAARAVLAAGGVVVNDARYVVDGKVALATLDGPPVDDPYALPTVSVPAAVLTGHDMGASFVISPDLVRRAGLATRPSDLVASLDHVLTEQETEQLTGRLREIGGGLTLSAERGAQFREEPIIWVLGVIAALIALGAAGVATGLTAADSRPDLATLGAVGASPRVRRLLSLSQSGVISGLGAVLGVLAGLGTAAALIAAVNHNRMADLMDVKPMTLTLPWDTLAIVLAVPLVAMAGAGLLTRSRLPIERRL